MVAIKPGMFSIVPIKSLFDLHPYQQVIYMWLCHHANEQNQCWPSIGLLAKECGLSKRSVIRHLEILEKNGYIQKQIRHKKEKVYQSNIYTVFVKDLDKKEVGGSVPQSPPLVTHSHSNYINKRTKSNNSMYNHRKEKECDKKERRLPVHYKKGVTQLKNIISKVVPSLSKNGQPITERTYITFDPKDYLSKKQMKNRYDHS